MLESSQRHIHSATHLFRLAQEALKNATRTNAGQQQPAMATTIPTKVTSQPLLNAAFQLGLQVTTTALDHEHAMQ